ncbi:hypothetical protein WICANDRAFT_78912 [Wickerhamomyces anomalus NRRL Y-366-8]|uniref:Uncharacterized protein n=1 Tax=Wickerhamomyces anomalus (strain ATCC 58044 / CBS 1984 / NCYC 433 / NRRL Y-366-8) TaxID=683960 RepID=A0A1E3P4R5_WICAA|nr:uncharacterized protein WICANDRAFT_78912 [Wickerhamomyces anomalus NRRL Y-366-8]ODQ60308.1 hypothetical protein WICANDRAFT_78912 [Wickerhamomyces anomalus NRRL Y-366-8]
MMNMQQRKKTQTQRKRPDQYNHNNNNNSNNHNNYYNNKQQSNFHSHHEPRKTIANISNIKEYTKGTIYGSLNYPIPSFCPKVDGPHRFNDLPSFTERPVAKLINSCLLASTYKETNLGKSDTNLRKSNDIDDPAVRIVTFKRQNAKVFKLGGIEIDIFKKNNVLSNNNNNNNGNNKLVNKFLQNESLNSGSTTPLKRIRDELVDASSSVKKNKRLQELQQDTTMELSFEGKAMDKNDYVKLVDSSGIMADDSHIPDTNPNTNQQSHNYDTKNLLQNTEFSFEYKR